MSEALALTFAEQLAKDLELGEVPIANANKMYTFSFGKSLAVDIQGSSFGFYFSSILGPCPKKECEEFFQAVMHANLFGKGTGEGVIGLNEEGTTLTFTKKFPFEMNYAEFKSQIEDFVNYADLWQKKLSDHLG